MKRKKIPFSEMMISNLLSVVLRLLPFLSQLNFLPHQDLLSTIDIKKTNFI